MRRHSQKSLRCTTAGLQQRLLLHLGRGLEILLRHPRRDAARCVGHVDVGTQRQDREDDYAEHDVDGCGIHCKAGLLEAQVIMVWGFGCWSWGALVGGGDEWWVGML